MARTRRESAKPAKSIKILLIDDHIPFCEGLIAAVTAQRRDIYIECGTGSFHPKWLGAIEIFRHLNKLQKFTPILVLSSVE